MKHHVVNIATCIGPDLCQRQ